MKTFFNSLHCSARAHCRACRDREGGRKWRGSLGMVFEDIHEIDFTCPHGLEWGAPKQIVIRTKRLEELEKKRKSGG